MPQTKPDIAQWHAIVQSEEELAEWASSFEACTWLLNNGIDYPQGAFESLLAVGIRQTVPLGSDTFQSLEAFHMVQKCWLFGFLTYDLKNELENLQSQNQDGLGFSKAFFYEPQFLFNSQLGNNSLWGTPEDLAYFQEAWLIFCEGKTQTPSETNAEKLNPDLDKLNVKSRVSKSQYLKDVEAIRQHIAHGDVYELNYCMEFYAQNCQINPFQLFQKLNTESPMPFAAFQKMGNKYVLCASPERFLRKNGQKLISQPIKGTVKRGSSLAEDEELKSALYNSEKERAENVMIVDLVRNDLARTAKVGSVKVEELCGIYTFRRLHQMISTVSAELPTETDWTEAIRHAFPMGSMTGAPKVKAMELIEQYEATKRGLYSGCIGYVSPSADFDFNVVIRSMLYDAPFGYLSFQVGSAITYDAIPAQEYDECLLKAQSMMRVLGLGL